MNTQFKCSRGSPTRTGSEKNPDKACESQHTASGLRHAKPYSLASTARPRHRQRRQPHRHRHRQQPLPVPRGHRPGQAHQQAQGREQRQPRARARARVREPARELAREQELGLGRRLTRRAQVPQEATRQPAASVQQLLRQRWGMQQQEQRGQQQNAGPTLVRRHSCGRQARWRSASSPSAAVAWSHPSQTC